MILRDTATWSAWAAEARVRRDSRFRDRLRRATDRLCEAIGSATESMRDLGVAMARARGSMVEPRGTGSG